MDFVPKLYHVRIHILPAPMAFVNVIVILEILMVFVGKVIIYKQCNKIITCVY